MHYISTRSKTPPATPATEPQDFAHAVRYGLAKDGGLYVPESFPAFDAAQLDAMRYLSYPELAVRIMRAFTGDSVVAGELAGMVQDSYARFTHPDVTPLTQLGDRLHLLELFHGPTLAFKDMALQFLGRVFGHFADEDHAELTVVGATSGDTGSAAIEGCRGIPHVRVFVLYPQDRPSEVQRRQMTTVDALNVHAIAVKGTFDDCQNLVKQVLNDPAMRTAHKLTAVNSINWARIMAQVVYYFYAGLKRGALQRPVNFVVPTGNFGNVYAGYVAKRMGLPVDKFIIATNSNDSLVHFINGHRLVTGRVHPSLSPSMDIQVASNVERYLFKLLNHDGNAVSQAFQDLKMGKNVQFPDAMQARIAADFMALSVSDAETEAAMRTMWEEKRFLADPHTAVGLHAARVMKDRLQGEIIALGCAHAAKFPETVKRVTGQTPPLPEHMRDIYAKKERITVIDNDYAALAALLNKK